MTELIEKVARAICEEAKMNPDDALGGWVHWKAEARAAIAAMTEDAPIWGEENGGVRGFMDKVDFECELGCASSGNVIYPSEEDCAESCASHIDSCGMVEVEVRLVRVVRPSRYYAEEG